MNGRRIIKKTTRTLLKTVFWMLLFIGVGIGTYKLTIAYYKSTGQYSAVDNDASKAIVKATTDTLAINAIFSVNGDDGTVRNLLLEIFHSDTGKLDFVTVPVGCQYAMSKELFATLSKANQNVPQILSWKDLPQYFTQFTAYQYGCMLLEESLGVHISFYTLMSDTTFKEYFEEKKTTTSDSTSVAKGYNLKETTRNKIKGLTTSSKMETELAAYYTKIQSNLSLSKRKTYLSAYQKADYDNIGVYSLPITGDTNQIATEDREWLGKILED